MHIFKGTQHLIKKKLMVLASQVIISFNDLMKIRLHKLKDNINISEVSLRWRQHNAFDLNYIWMAQQPQQFYFSENSDGIRNVLKNIIYFLNGNFFPCMCINCSTNNSITSFPNNFKNFVSICITIIGEKFCVFYTLRSKKEEKKTQSY